MTPLMSRATGGLTALPISRTRTRLLSGLQHPQARPVVTTTGQNLRILPTTVEEFLTTAPSPDTNPPARGPQAAAVRPLGSSIPETPHAGCLWDG